MAAWWARPRSPDGARTQARRTNPWPTASDDRCFDQSQLGRTRDRL
jgi:hypothetical protein